MTRREWVEGVIDRVSALRGHDNSVATELRALWAVLDAARDAERHCYTGSLNALRDAMDAYDEGQGE